jgi:ELWxxDGT repeat protein
LESLEDRRVMAFGAQMVADLGGSLHPQNSDPRDFVEVNGTTFFSAKTSTTGYELWKTDGTTVGTKLVKDIFPGSMSSNPQQLVSANGMLYFVAEDGVHGMELWRSDGTAQGTQMIADLSPGKEHSFIWSKMDNRPLHSTVLAIGNDIFFATDNQESTALWKTDGTQQGTVLIKRFDGGWGPDRFTEFKGELYFESYNRDSGYELWKSDGTEAGTQIVLDITPQGDYGRIKDIFAADDKLYFVATDLDDGRENEVTLWRTDGTSAGTIPLKVIGTSGDSLETRSFALVNGTMFFRNYDAYSGWQLWKSDGTANGTVQVVVAEGIRGPSYISNLHVLNEVLFFTATTPGGGSEVWKSNGLESGTRPVTAFPSHLGVAPDSLTVYAGSLYFRAGSFQEGMDLWKLSDTEGTRLVKKFDGPDYAFQLTAGRMSVSNGLLYLGGFTLGAGQELWRSDGTEVGTIQVRDIASANRSSNPLRLEPVGNQMFFMSEADGNYPYHTLWKTDGSARGTVAVAPIPTNEHPALNCSANLNGTLFFGGDPYAAAVTGLWKSDGTAAGTVLVKQLAVSHMAVANGTLFFIAEGGLWKSDGTEAGTVLLKSAKLAGSGLKSQLVSVGGTLFFAIENGVNGSQIWKTDGTPEGTALVKDLPGTDGIDIGELVSFNGKLYFNTRVNYSTRQLWSSDGTEAGTYIVTTFEGGSHRSFSSPTVHNGKLYLFASMPDGQLGLYKTDGGVGELELVAPVGPRLDQYDDYYYANTMASVNGKLYFVGSDPVHGDELWISDGTTAGTRLYQDIAQVGGSRPENLTVFQNTLYFVADDGIHGNELWKLAESSAPPVIAGLGGAITYKENTPVVPISPWATVSDTDSPHFAFGALTVQQVGHVEKSDQLIIRHAGMVKTRGQEILYGEHVIGTWAGGFGDVPLTVSFNAKTSPYRAQAVLRNVVYSNSSENPSPLPRTVRVQLTDGRGGVSAQVSKTINVVPVNDVHEITVSSAPIGYQMNGPAVAVMTEAVLTDVDNLHFGGGKLVVRLTEPDASNRLEIGGGFYVMNQQVMYASVTIGTLSWQGGVGERNLAVTFNSNATVARVENLMRSIRFRTVGATEAKPRTLEMLLIDGNWPVAKVTKTINVSA